MRIAMAGDHAGFPLKPEMVELVCGLGHEVLDLGGDGTDAQDDYPDYARAVAEAVRSGQVDRGILLCGSGVGASIAANKVPGIRAAVCHDTYSARQGVEHDDMNVLVLGGRIVGPALAEELVRAFLEGRFLNRGKYLRRLKKVLAIEAEYSNEEFTG